MLMAQSQSISGPTYSEDITKATSILFLVFPGETQNTLTPSFRDMTVWGTYLPSVPLATTGTEA